MTTALFLLRCTEIGITIADLDLLTIGLVMDMWTEKGNDGVAYDKVASQEEQGRGHFTAAALEFFLEATSVTRLEPHSSRISGSTS